MPDRPSVPQIPSRFTDPRPVLATGTGLWVLAIVGILRTGDRFEEYLPVCLAGFAVGALGTTIFTIQRRAARRGSKGAQTGLV